MKQDIRPKGLVTHKRADCDSQHCVIHNPSSHKMDTWPIFIRLDKYALAERTCSHGVGHPDPDSVDYFRRRKGEEFAGAMATHGCDGCCHA